MRMCLINDCNINNNEPALCCFDCSDRDVCPDRCPRSEITFCVGVIDDKDTSGTIKEKPIIH
jgi:hypothetical protein